MKIIDDLKAAIGAGKKDDKFKNVTNKDEILDMVEQVLTPIVNKIDAALADADETDTKPAEEKPAEAKPAEEKKDDKPAADKKEESEEMKNLKAELENMKKEQEKLRNHLAGQQSKPAAESANSSSSLSKVSVEYAE